MTESTVPPNVMQELATLDTPTVCNALELVVPERRGEGYTVRPLFCLRPEMEPIVGFARTATVSAIKPSDLSAAEAKILNDQYYEYMGTGLAPLINVIEDIDGEYVGYGAWWGEVNTSIHHGLGSLGVITNGSIRDLPDSSPGFQLLAGSVSPSHAYIHVVEFNLDVTVMGMKVKHNDLIHADQHGAVVIPIEVAGKVKAAAEKIAAQEAIIISAAREPGFDINRLRQAWKGDKEIH